VGPGQLAARARGGLLHLRRWLIQEHGWVPLLLGGGLLLGLGSVLARWLAGRQ